MRGGMETEMNEHCFRCRCGKRIPIRKSTGLPPLRERGQIGERRGATDVKERTLVNFETDALQMGRKKGGRQGRVELRRERPREYVLFHVPLKNHMMVT